MMTRGTITWLVALAVSACASDDAATSSEQQAGMQMQAPALQGVQLQGMQMQGMNMLGFQFAGATLNGSPLTNVRVEKGELVAEQGAVTLHGIALKEAHLIAQVRDITTSPPATALVEYKISEVEDETMANDPTHTGSTFLYTLDQYVDNVAMWQPACPTDSDGRRAAIPLAAIWDEHGDRIESTTLFTFGCTLGVIAKCYRWGYRPWVTGYGDLTALHWTCTRLARADYCGNGKPNTHDGTLVNVWDNLPSPGPIQSHGLTPLGMLFEAGWSTSGAVCLSHARWLLGGTVIAQACPDRLIPPSLLGGTVCDLVSEVLGNGMSPRMFDETDLHVNLDLF